MKKREFRIVSAICCALLVLGAVGLFLTGCGVPGATGSKTTGSVTLSFNAIEARSILPPISMAAVEYEVTATGPKSSTYGPTVLTGTTQLTGMLPGHWDFQVTGRNATHDPIGAGSGGIDVIVGQSNPLTIVVHENSDPTGSMRVQLQWEPDVVTSPLWQGLLSRGGVDDALAFTMDTVACTADTSKSGMVPGWYLFVAKLFDAPLGLDGSEVQASGAATAIRVAKGLTTDGTLQVHAIQGHGTIELMFDNDFNDELQMTPVPAFGPLSIHTGNSQDFSVATDKPAATAWYLNGVQQAVGSTFNLDAGSLLDGQSYRLDAVSFALAGEFAGSGTWNVTRVSFADADYGFSVSGRASDSGAITIALLNLDGTTAQSVTTGSIALGSNWGPYDFPLMATGEYIIKLSRGATLVYYGGATHYPIPVVGGQSINVDWF